MEYRRLGRTDLKVSSLCLGTMTWGSQNTAEEGHAQMDMALDHGINFFDTAEMYAVPASPETSFRTETIIGDWFARTGHRDKVILATKAAGPGDYVKHIRGGPGSVRRACKAPWREPEAPADRSHRPVPAPLAGAHHQLLWPAGLQAPGRGGRHCHQRHGGRPQAIGGCRQDPPLGPLQ